PPLELFDRFPRTGTVEIHLATEFQNMIYEHPMLPEQLRREIYEYLKTNFQSERKEGETEQQFIYKTRKKGFGPFKKEFLNLDESVKEAIMNDLEEKFSSIFRKLGISGTAGKIEKFF
ncbi:MAG: aldolase, partial [Deltaproteobacteria bacterium]|nr:aldolase [Deltaproteobacteria bacterium]